MKKFYLILSLLFATFISASAYDFSAANENGTTIYYQITGDNTVSVTFGSNEFTGNEYVGDIVVPEQVTYEDVTYTVTAVGDWAFYLCSNITSVSLPNSVTLIGIHAFHNCSSMTVAVVGDGITYVGEQAFRGCSSLFSIKFTSVDTIDKFAFYQCTSMTSVNLGDSLTTLGEGAFADCSGLPSIELPATITTIGVSAFMSCTGLTSFTVLNPDPDSITIYDNTFYNVPIVKSVTLYVPKGCKELYENAYYWEDFAKIEELDSSVDAVKQDNGVATYYNIAGMRVAEPQRGNIYIKVVDGTASKVVYCEK